MQARFFVRDEIALRPLRPLQESAIAQIRQAIREGHKRIVLMAPTGFGKTLTAAHIIAGALSKGKRPMFVCPAIALVNQTLASFEGEGIRDIGVIQAQHERTDFTAAVQIASVQTLIRRTLPQVDFVLIDEVHITYDKLNQILDGDAWRDKVVIGLSATPWAKGMGLRWTKLVIAATTKGLIDGGFLTPFRVFAPASDPDLSKVKIVKGEYEERGASLVMSDKLLIADIVKTWLEKGENRPTFLFAVDCAHARFIRAEFLQAGVSCGYIDGNSTDDERKDTFRRFRSGEDKIIASVGCLIAGIDEDVRCVIDAQPLSKSEIRHVQKIGRGLRTAPGKADLIVLDHAGNTQRIGLVTDIHHDALDRRRPSEREIDDGEREVPKPVKCPACHAIFAPRKLCPNCGYKFPFKEAKNMVATRDGDLVEYGSGKKKQGPSQQAKGDFYAEVLFIAQEKGYAPGWAAHKYKERYGDWPRERRQPVAPSLETVRYLKHLQIRWARRKEKAQPVSVGL